MSTTLNVTHRTDGVAVLTFDMPNSRANILTRQVWEELHSALKALRHRDGVKGLVLASAKQGIFIAGADLKFFANVPAPNNSQVRELIEFGNATLNLLEELPFPTCAAINGAAVGGGLEVALACDFRLCGSDPKVELGLPETKIGLIPGWGGTQRLPRLGDLSTAVRMLVTGESLTAEQAITARLVDTPVVTGDLVDAAAWWLVAQNPEPHRRAKQEALPLLDRELMKEAILALGTPSSEAVREVTNVMLRGGEQPLRDALPIETAAFLRVAGSDESKRRIAEFFAARKKG
jgi:enoyl-CoA hydratase/carnithine racemase